ncbi:MAG: arginine N-succinyltransferase [bacterium]
MGSSDIVIRPVAETDLDDLIELARLAGPGMTSLPSDPEILEQRVLASLEACRKLTEEPEGESYLFVAEDRENNQLAGTAGIVSRVGGFEPFYAFRIETEEHSSESINLSSTNKHLSLVKDHDGPCELTGLFVHPDYRETGLGTILSRSRLLYVANSPDQFDSTVIAELRGQVDENGVPPFWRDVMRNFFPMDFGTADGMTLRNKEFIDDLVPEHPIYLSLISEAARSAIGAVHTRTRPAAEILKAEGFERTDTVDIFDAGAILSCPRDDVKTISSTREFTVSASLPSREINSFWLVASFSPEYRSTKTRLKADSDGTCKIPKATIDRLSISIGDSIKAVPCSPS